MDRMIDHSVIRETTWDGFRRIDVLVDGRDAVVVVPQTPAPGKPWVWRTEYFGAFAQADVAMAHKGWHVAYVNVSASFAAANVLETLHEFQRFVEAAYGLSPRPAIFGFSRAAHLAVRYAARYPEKTGALYLDNPLFDIRSQIAAPGNSFHSDKEMLAYLAGFGMKVADAPAFEFSVLDKSDIIMKAGIPVLIVVGVADDVILESENTALLERRYHEAGKEITIIRKPGCGHHPHSLEDPGPIVDFLLRNTIAGRKS